MAQTARLLSETQSMAEKDNAGPALNIVLGPVGLMGALPCVRRSIENSC